MSQQQQQSEEEAKADMAGNPAPEAADVHAPDDDADLADNISPAAASAEQAAKEQDSFLQKMLEEQKTFKALLPSLWYQKRELSVTAETRGLNSDRITILTEEIAYMTSSLSESRIMLELYVSSTLTPQIRNPRYPPSRHKPYYKKFLSQLAA